MTRYEQFEKEREGNRQQRDRYENAYLDRWLDRNRLRQTGKEKEIDRLKIDR